MSYPIIPLSIYITITDILERENIQYNYENIYNNFKLLDEIGFLKASHLEQVCNMEGEDLTKVHQEVSKFTELLVTHLKKAGRNYINQEDVITVFKSKVCELIPRIFCQ